jgi:hypothetical protein
LVLKRRSCERFAMRAHKTSRPSASPHRAERRQSRSPYRYRAAELYLDAVCTRRGLSAIVLSDEVGVLAGSGPLGCDLDDLALAGAARLGRPASRSLSDRDVHAAPLTLVGRPHRLTALGGTFDADGVQGDLERILSTRP